MNTTITQETAHTCFAYKDGGGICGEPATILDEQRGCYVCEAHRPAPRLISGLRGPIEANPTSQEPGENPGNSAQAPISGGGAPQQPTASGGGPERGLKRNGADESAAQLTNSEVNLGAAAPVIELPLSPEEQLELIKCMAKIDQGLKSYWEMGLALETIRRLRLFRATHLTFDAWLKDNYGWTSAHARQLRRAGKVVAHLRSWMLEQRDCSLTLPGTESQARMLATLPQQHWGPAWQEIVSTAPAGRVTQKHAEERIRARRAHLGLAPAEEAEPPDLPISNIPIGVPTPPAPSPGPALPAGRVIDVLPIETRQQRQVKELEQIKARLEEMVTSRTANSAAFGRLPVAVEILDECLRSLVERDLLWPGPRDQDRRKEYEEAKGQKA